MTPDRGNAPGAERPRTAPAWVKTAVLLHLFAITVWTLPNLPKPIQDGKVQPVTSQWILYWNAKYLKTLNPVKAYLFVTGMWQYWDMFAPNPASIDWYLTADVEYRDGTHKSVAYPRVYDLPIAEKFFKERYRKFYERQHDEKKPMNFPALAQKMAVLGHHDPKNPPVAVRLVRHWLIIAEPGKKQETKYGSYPYYAYSVDQAWLRRAAGER